MYILYDRPKHNKNEQPIEISSIHRRFNFLKILRSFLLRGSGDTVDLLSRRHAFAYLLVGGTYECQIIFFRNATELSGDMGH